MGDVSSLAHLAVVAEQVELSSAAADLRGNAGPWEVAGRRGSELTGMHLLTTLTHVEHEKAECPQSRAHFLCVCVFVCALTLRGRCRKGLSMQQIQSTLVLLVFLLCHQSGFLGAAALPVVQLATFGQQLGPPGFGRGLDHRHQSGTLFLPTGVLLEYSGGGTTG